MRLKPAHTLFLTAIIGITAGYLAAPDLLPLLRHSLNQLQQKAEEPQPTAQTPTVDTPNQEDLPTVYPAGSDDLIPDDTDDADFIADDDSRAEEDDVFFPETEEPEEDDPEGNNTTPTRITTYKPKYQGAEDEQQKPFREQTFTGKLNPTAWNSPKTLKRNLAAKVRTHLKGTDQQAVENLLLDPEVRLMLAQWELLNRSNLDTLGKLMRNTGYRESLTPLLNDLEWVSGFVYDAELQNAEIALAMIAHFQQVDPDMAKDVQHEGIKPSPWLKRRVAGAIATQFTRHGWYGEDKELTKEELAEMKKLGYFMPTLPGERKRGRNKQDVYRAARERYLYFAESIDKGLLHTSFWQLPTWQLHYVCGWKGNSPFGTASTMRWLRDNCAAPAAAYVNMCRQVPYLPTNVYGDSIHSEWYYQPFDVLYPGNFAKETRDVGAVCGGLSHFGASSACANGVPAITMGEPAHCAYAVYFDGAWHPANSLHPEERRSPHWSIWGETTWAALQLQEDMYTRGAITRNAQMLVTLASIMAENRNPLSALPLYELAVQMQPLYKPVWGLYLSTAAKTLGKRPLRWLGVNEFVCNSIAPQHPKSCALLLQESVYPGMLTALRSPKQKLAAYEAYLTNLTTNEKEQWDYRALLTAQYNSLGKALSHKEHYMQMLIDNVAKSAEFGHWVAWAVITAHQENKSMFKKVLGMLESAVARHPETKDAVCSGIIRGAEEIGDIELANLWSTGYLDSGKNMPGFEPVGGNLVSAEGLVKLGSYADDQSLVLHHAAALTEKGGSICTQPNVQAFVTVELPEKEHIGGIVLVGNGVLSVRGYLVVEISTDGKNWKHLVELSREESGKKLARLNLTRNHPSAKFIRITDHAVSGEAQINLKAILVYDNKKVK
ncbi:MAG: hypothetical protein IJ993_00730 [Akkermansia sp.]|nr:hypothetical protein [Akkermansia sp.]